MDQGFYRRIVAYRQSASKEATRLRVASFRNKMKVAALEGDAEMIKKMKGIKKSDRVKSSNYRKAKRVKTTNVST